MTKNNYFSFFLGTNCSVKMNCPISGLQQHNAVVLGIESITDNTVRIYYFQFSLNYVLFNDCRYESYFANQHV